MKKTLGLGLILVILTGVYLFNIYAADQSPNFYAHKSYWFKLRRKSNQELLYFGEAGRVEKSALVRIFEVKTGIPGKKPTPLPQLLGREYWVIKNKLDSSGYPETAPYFLTLDVPVSAEFPYGPEPYLECNGQCDWELPGSFGLHGVDGDSERLADGDPGSSGCIRHKDEDITYLYNLLDPGKEEIHYYIDDV